jgi:protein-disulfide isomerase
MAQQRSLKNFYLGLGAVAVLGGGALVYMTQRDGGPVVLPTGVLPVGMDSVPPAAYQIGSDTAPVVVDEFSDFECPYCMQMSILILPDIKRRYIETGLVRWRFNDFPIDTHLTAPLAHLAAACAAEQNQFWPMHDAIYGGQGQWVRGGARGMFEGYARQIGIDMNAWQTCMSDREPLTRIAQTVQRGQAIGVSGTPTIFVNGQLVRLDRLSFDRLASAIEAALPR